MSAVCTGARETTVDFVILPSSAYWHVVEGKIEKNNDGGHFARHLSYVCIISLCRLCLLHPFELSYHCCSAEFIIAQLFNSSSFARRSTVPRSCSSSIRDVYRRRPNSLRRVRLRSRRVSCWRRARRQLSRLSAPLAFHSER